LLISSVVRIGRSVAKLQNFVNTVHQQLAPTRGLFGFFASAYTRTKLAFPKPKIRASPMSYYQAGLHDEQFRFTGGVARPMKITMPSPPGFDRISVLKSGFQLLMDQIFPA
jgi:hypothetical protein